MRSTKINSTLIILTVFTLVFFPVLSFVFGLKNDILTGYLPVKFFISESINSGYFPWWNPYINFGIPQHADLSSGFWNPITWLISLTVGYNVYTITLELLFYILIGALGIYRIGNLQNWATTTRLVSAISYMGCGYFIGQMQHLNWVSAAGFLPWCYLFYSQMLKQTGYKMIILTVIAFYFFITSAHPGLIIGALYFFGILTLHEFYSAFKRDDTKNRITEIFRTILLFITILVIVLAGLILSYTEIIPYINRDAKPALSSIVQNTTSFKSLISFILPAATTKNSSTFLSDISLRNFYLGLLPLIFLLSSYNFCKKEKALWGLLFISIFFLLLSLPSFFQEILYEHFPFIGYVRLPGEFRIFSLFGFLIISCSHLNNFLKHHTNQKIIFRVIYFLILAMSILGIWSIINIVIYKEGIVFNHLTIQSKKSLTSILNYYSDNITIYDLIILQSLLQITILLFVRKILKQKKNFLLVSICIIDIFLSASINLPFTGYGQTSTRKLQEYLSLSPKGIPIPRLKPLIANQKGPKGMDSILGSWSFYNKEIGTLHHAFYPIIFKTEEKIFKPQTTRNLQTNSYLYFEEDAASDLTKKSITAIKKKPNGSNIKIIRFSPNYIKAEVLINNPGYITLLYKKYLHWNCYIDGVFVQPEKSNQLFFTLYIKNKGKHTIEFKYMPNTIIYTSFIGTICFLLLISLLFFFKKN